MVERNVYKPREPLYVTQRDSVKLNLISRMCCAKRITEAAAALGSDFPKWQLSGKRLSGLQLCRWPLS